MQITTLAAAAAFALVSTGAVASGDGHGSGGAMPAAALTGANFGALLTPGAEVPPVASPTNASGKALLRLSDDRSTLDVDVVFRDFGSPTLFAHIHCCAPATGTAGVAIDFGGFPVGVLEGAYARSFDLNSLATFSGGFVTANGGTLAGARAAFLAGFEGGRAYVNIHSQLNRPGELRGQIAAIPEPATWVSMIVGFGLIGGAMRRRAALRPAVA